MEGEKKKGWEDGKEGWKEETDTEEEVKRWKWLKEEQSQRGRKGRKKQIRTDGVRDRERGSKKNKKRNGRMERRDRRRRRRIRKRGNKELRRRRNGVRDSEWSEGQ